ncbi:MAG: hypothetical protein NXI10_05125 [bacterium]|nr:hypothetical protein [bacterium]
MKLYFSFLALFVIALASCVSKSENESIPPKGKDKIVPVHEDFRHIITESKNDYPMALRSDKDILLYDRMILEIEMKSDGSLMIEGEKADWKTLKDEMNLFFNANRELTNTETSWRKKNDNHSGGNYPYFQRFTRDSYASYIEQLKKMAEKEMKAGIYLQRHARSIKAFDAVDDNSLPFLNPLSLIRYVYSDEVTKEKVTELEDHLAKNLFKMRDELAQEKFGKGYDLIRSKAATNSESAKQLLFLQEMYPAYFLGLKASELEEVKLPEPPKMPAPPREEIVTEEILEK